MVEWRPDEWREGDRRPQADRPGAPGPPPRRPLGPRPLLRRMLSSRRTLRQAVLLHEVLGKPRGLERLTRETSGSPAGPHPLATGHDRNGNGTLTSRSELSQQPGDLQPEVIGQPGPPPERERTVPPPASGTPSIVASALSAFDASNRALRRFISRLRPGA
jgi:hypothetical protein